MDLRRHLNDETQHELLALTSAAKNSPAVLFKEARLPEPWKPESQLEVPPAELRKAQNLPSSQGKLPIKSASTVDRNPNGKSLARKQKNDPFLDVAPSPAPARSVREPVQHPIFKLGHKPFNPKPAEKIRSASARGMLGLSGERFAILCSELLVTVHLGGGKEYITGSDFEKLRLHIARESMGLAVAEELSFKEKLRLKSGTSQWQAEGTPLRRYESKKVSRARETPRSSAPFIQVVSGGLPTLGKGRK